MHEPDDAKNLSIEEELVLSVFKVRNVRDGYGLTYTTFRGELTDRPALDLRATLRALTEKGYVQVDPQLRDFYILTRKGCGHIGGSP